MSPCFDRKLPIVLVLSSCVTDGDLYTLEKEISLLSCGVPWVGKNLVVLITLETEKTRKWSWPKIQQNIQRESVRDKESYIEALFLDINKELLLQNYRLESPCNSWFSLKTDFAQRLL